MRWLSYISLPAPQLQCLSSQLFPQLLTCLWLFCSPSSQSLGGADALARVRREVGVLFHVACLQHKHFSGERSHSWGVEKEVSFSCCQLFQISPWLHVHSHQNLSLYLTHHTMLMWSDYLFFSQTMRFWHMSIILFIIVIQVLEHSKSLINGYWMNEEDGNNYIFLTTF